MLGEGNEFGFEYSVNILSANDQRQVCPYKQRSGNIYYAVVDSVLSLLGFPILSAIMWTLWKWSNKSNCFISLLSSEIYVMTSAYS